MKAPHANAKDHETRTGSALRHALLHAPLFACSQLSSSRLWPLLAMLLAALLLPGLPVARAQTPLPDEFDPGANGGVYALAVQADGKILVGGSFTVLAGQSRSGIARLNADGTLDGGFNPGGNNSVLALAVQPDGKILVGGSLTTLDGQWRINIARLNADGTLDSGFNPGVGGSYPWVYSLAIQADGKILVGGSFTTLGGQPRNCIGRLNADGTLDSGFNPGANTNVYSLAVQADGKVLVGGSFTTLGGQWRTNIARLNADGTLDSGFNPGAGRTDGHSPLVLSLALQADGKILMGGGFITVGGQTRNRIARLNADGTLDNGFNQWTTDGVISLAVQADGKILMGGDFTTVGGQTRNRIARLNADGTLDNGFDPGANSTVYSVAVQADGKILVGGSFTTLGGQPRNRIARLSNTAPATQGLTYDGSMITWLRGGSSPEIWRTTFEVSTNGTDWTPLGAGSRIPGGWQLNSVSLPLDGTLRARGYVSGGYQNASGWFVEAYSGRLVFVAHPAGRTNDAGTTAKFYVVAGGSEPLSFQWRKEGVPLVDSGKIAGAATAALSLTNVLSGDAGAYSVVVGNSLGSVTSATARLTVIDPAVAVQPVSQKREPGQSATFSVTAVGTAPFGYQWWKNGVALTGGTGSSLTLANLQAGDAGNYQVVVSNQYGSVTSVVAELSVNLITLDDGFNPGASYEVSSFAVQADGKVLVGGWFTNVAGQPRNRIARLEANGTLDSSFDPNASGWEFASVLSLAVQGDGKIVVGGDFKSVGGQPRTNIARLNPDGTLDRGFSPGTASREVNCLAVQSDGKILAGGWFTEMAGQARSRIARLNPDGTLDSDFNPDLESTNYSSWAVDSLGVQADGKILVGGRFTSVRGQPRSHIARLNADGTLDSGFNPGTSGGVSCFAVQSDGKILAGGWFTEMAGQTRNRIARLNADGTLDGGFNPGADDQLDTMAVQADGKILVGGWFTTLGGQPRNYIARLNADGTLDSGFNPGANIWVFSLAVQVDGKILVGGHFTSLGGQPRSRIGRLNNTAPATQSLSYEGSTITWLRGGTSPEVWRATFEVFTNGDGWISLGGGSRIPGGWQLTGIALPSNGTLRSRGYVSGGRNNGSGWLIETYYGMPVFLSQPPSRTNEVGTMATFSVVVNGSAPLLGFQWLKNGIPIAEGGNHTGVATTVLQLANVLGVDAGGYSVVASNAFGSVTSAVARLTVMDPAISVQPTSLYAEPGQSVTFSVTAVGTASFGYQWWREGIELAGRTGASLTLTNVQMSDAGTYHVVVSNQYGSVTSTGVSLSVNLAKVDTEFNPTLFSPVLSLAVQTDKKILVGGEFSYPRYEGTFRLNADGTLDSPFYADSSKSVESMAIQADGGILVAGSFWKLVGPPPWTYEPRDRVARVGGFALEADGEVSSLAIQSDGKILVGGWFSMLGGQPHRYIGRLNADGSHDAGFNPGVAGVVFSLAIQPDGRILVGGVFTTVGGQPRQNLARMNTNGSLDTGFNPGVGGGSYPYVYSLALQADDRILVGGQFTTLGGEPRSCLGRLNADGTLDTGFNPGADAWVRTLALQTDGKILVGGNFTKLSGQPRNQVARLNPDGMIDSGFDPGGGGEVFSLAVQADGKILVGGNFTTLGGQPRNCLGRLNNTEPATQKLSYDGSTITWLRGGTSPEVWRTTFEVSTNGGNWTMLGVGIRVPGGWRLTGVEVPPSGTLRARGFVSGSDNCSGWFVETVRDIDATRAPVIVVNDGQFGIRSNRFGFTITGSSAASVVVEGSSNLLHWTPLTTNSPSAGPVNFSEPAWPQTPQRFYRVRVWP